VASVLSPLVRKIAAFSPTRLCKSDTLCQDNQISKEYFSVEQTLNNLVPFCWSIADLLPGDFKQSQYGSIILPFTLLRRLEGVLEDSKASVLEEYEKVQNMGLPEEG
jgi:hypothetical protein